MQIIQPAMFDHGRTSGRWEELNTRPCIVEVGSWGRPAIEQEKVQPEPSRLGGALHKTCVPKKGDTMICAKGAIYDLNQQNRWSTDFGQLIPQAPSVSSNRQHVLPCFCDVCFLRDHEFQTAQGSCESCAGGRAMWCSLNSHHCLVQSWHRTWQAQATPPKTEAEGNQRTRFRH